MKSRIVLSLCVGMLMAGTLSAAQVRWNGAVDEFWSNPDNWRESRLPVEGDKAQIVDGGSAVIDFDAGIVKNLAMEAGGSKLQLVDGAQLTVWEWSILAYVGGEEGNRHTLEVLGGVFNGGDVNRDGNGRVYVGRAGFAELVIDNSGVVNVIHQELGVGVGDNGDGIVSLKGGTLNLSDNGDWPLRIATGNNATGLVDLSGGVIKQRFSQGRLDRIEGYIEDGSIVAYSGYEGLNTVVVDTGDANDFIHVRGLHHYNPVPMDGGNVVPGNITLEWTVDAGTLVDVWFGTSPDWNTWEPLVEKQAATSVSTTVDPKQRYFWAVDTYASPDAEEPNYGPVFDFLADNQAPVVDAGEDVTTWIDSNSVEVALSGTVIDMDPTTTLWTVVSEPDDPNNPDAVIADPAALDTTVTLSALGTYVLKLTANDGEYDGEDTVTINVYSDHCEAAKSIEGWEAIEGDINLDCVVDEIDQQILTDNWLKCNGLDCP